MNSIQRNVLIAALSLCLTACQSQAPPPTYMVTEIGTINSVLPLAEQPDYAQWKKIKPGMTEEQVTELLGLPYRKDPRPEADADPRYRHLYGWQYGEITFNSFTTDGSFLFEVVFHDGRVYEIWDPFGGRLSKDGTPTVPTTILPVKDAVLSHYPRFMDFRWHPSSGDYPMQYRIEIQVLQPNIIDGSGEVIKHDVVQQEWVFDTHDVYAPLTWVGANIGRWRVSAKNAKGSSEWSEWSYFEFDQ